MSSCFVSSRLVEPLAGQGLDTTGRPSRRTAPRTSRYWTYGRGRIWVTRLRSR